MAVGLYPTPNTSFSVQMVSYFKSIHEVFSIISSIQLWVTVGYLSIPLRRRLILSTLIRLINIRFLSITLIIYYITNIGKSAQLSKHFTDFIFGFFKIFLWFCLEMWAEFLTLVGRAGGEIYPTDRR